MKQKTVVITGATGGIGTALTACYAKAGYRVVAGYGSNTAAAQALEKQWQAIPMAVDLQAYSQIQSFAARALETLGQVHVLINNAAVSYHGLFQCMDRAAVQKLYAINVMGTIETTRAFLPAMIARHSGCIINLSSMWGEVGASCEVDYSATKGAILAFTRALAKEVGPSGIRVNCVSPGMIDTPMNRELDPSVAQEIAADTPLERIGTPEDIAQAVYWLSSPAASFITGQDLPVNGGYVIGSL